MKDFPVKSAPSSRVIWIARLPPPRWNIVWTLPTCFYLLLKYITFALQILKESNKHLLSSDKVTERLGRNIGPQELGFLFSRA